MSAPRTPPARVPFDRPCKACGAPLVFAEVTEGGKTTIVPLDVRNLPTYQLVIHEGVAHARPTAAYNSHFNT